jgi:WD40 repeat protein
LKRNPAERFSSDQLLDLAMRRLDLVTHDVGESHRVDLNRNRPSVKINRQESVISLARTNSAKSRHEESSKSGVSVESAHKNDSHSQSKSAVSQNDHQISRIELKHWKTLLLIEAAHKDSVYCLVEWNSRNLISCGGLEDRTIKIWEKKTSTCLKTLSGHLDGVYALKLLRKNMLVSGSGDSTLMVWNLDEDKCVQTLKGHTWGVNCILVLKNGEILSGSEDRTIKRWNVEKGQCLQTLKGGHSGSVNCLEIMGENKLASGGNDAKVIKGTRPVAKHY